MAAAANGQVGVVRSLLDAGASTGLKDKTGETALDCAEQARNRLFNGKLPKYNQQLTIAQADEIIELIQNIAFTQGA